MTDPTPASVPSRLFVYGTLREGGGAPRSIRRLMAAGSRKVAEGVIEGRLLDAGGFPAAVPGEGGEVRGEVRDLSRPEEVLALLDRYEGCSVPDGPFRRTVVRVRLDGGGTARAWAYIFDRPGGNLPEVPSGDWLSHRRQGSAGGIRRASEEPSTREGRTDVTLRLQSAAFDDGGRIPDRHTCEGPDVSPPLSWEGVPSDARSLALVVDDPDAPGTTWDHWVIWGLAPERRELPEDVGPDDAPDGAVQGVNDFGDPAWGGPCPPPGDGDHRYRFRLLALDAEPGPGTGAGKAELLAAADGHVLDEAVLAGTYSR